MTEKNIDTKKNLENEKPEDEKEREDIIFTGKVKVVKGFYTGFVGEVIGRKFQEVEKQDAKGNPYTALIPIYQVLFDTADVGMILSNEIEPLNADKAKQAVSKKTQKSSVKKR